MARCCGGVSLFSCSHLAGCSIGALGDVLIEEEPTSGQTLVWNAEEEAWVPGGGESLFYYPETYGAVGDGVADDTDAVQDAIDAAFANGGGTVWLTQRYGWRGDLLHKGGVTVRGVAVNKVLAVDDEMDRGLVALDSTARYRYGQWGGGSLDDNPGGIYDLVIDGADVSDPEGAMVVMQCVDGFISNCRIVRAAGNGLMLDGCQNGTIDQCFIGRCGGIAVTVDRIDSTGQGAGSMKISRCYLSTSAMLLYASSDPLNFWPHDIYVTECLLENYEGGEIVYLKAGEFQFTRTIFTNSNDAVPASNCLVLIDQSALASFIPTQAHFDSCYWNTGTDVEGAIRTVTNVGVDIGSVIRVSGKTYCDNSCEAFIVIDAGGPTISVTGDQLFGQDVVPYKTINGGALNGVFNQTFTGTRKRIPNLAGVNPADEWGVLGEDKNRLQLEINASAGWTFRSLNGADSISRGTFRQSPFDDDYGFQFTSRLYISGGLDLQHTVQTLAADAAVSIDARNVASQQLWFTANNADATSVTLTNPIDGAMVWIEWIAFTNNTINWTAGTPINFIGAPPQPADGQRGYVLVKYETSGVDGWYEVTRSRQDTFARRMVDGSQSLTSGTTYTDVLWQTAGALRGGIAYNAGTGEFTVSVPGLYDVTVAVAIAASNLGRRGVQLLKNGTIVPGAYSNNNPPATDPYCSPFSVKLDLVAGDVLKVQAKQNSGSSLAVSSPESAVSISLVR